MPLARVGDEEPGMGLMSWGRVGADGVPLRAGLPLQPHPDRPQSWTRRDAFLYRKLTAAIAAGHSEVSIDTAEADAVRGRDDPPLPGAFDVLAVIVAGSQDAVRRGEYRGVIGSAARPPGGP